MSSSHCLGKARQSRQERLATRRATVPNLSHVERSKFDATENLDEFLLLLVLEKQNLFDAVNAQEYDQGSSCSPGMEGFQGESTSDLRLVLDLLQSGADPRISDKHARTPLHVASTKLDAAIGKERSSSRCRSFELFVLVKALVDHGADVNAEDCIGNTPLHLACISGRVAIVGILLRAGANLSPTKTRSTPLTLALSRLQSMMNEKRTISSPTVKAEILDVRRNENLHLLTNHFLLFQLIRMLKNRASTVNIESNASSMINLCQQLENLNTSLDDDSSSLDPNLISNLTISIYKNVHL